MPIPASDLTSWIVDRCQPARGVTLDRIVMEVRRGPRAWPQHAEIRVEDKQAAEVVDELLKHAGDVDASAADNGETSCVIRLRAYRAKSPDGSRDFRWSLPASEHGEAGDAESPEQALVQTVSVLTRANVDLTKTIRDQANGTAGLALGLLKELAAMHQERKADATEVAELKAALVLAEKSSPEMEVLTKMAGDLIPVVAPLIVARLAAPKAD